MRLLTISLFLLLFLSMNINAQTYYTEADSLKKAQEIGGDHLISYKDGIATFDVNIGTENHVMKAYDVNLNPEYHYQNNCYKEIEFENTYRNYISGKGAVIAIIDSGCNINHYDLRDNIIGCYNSTDSKDKYDVTDKDGHGTSIAAIIAASDNNYGIVGIAPDAKLFIIKASYGDDGYFHYSDVIRAINKCVELGYIDVINLSLGGYYKDDLMEKALRNARSHGILVVCASGNESTSKPTYPAAYQVGLSVASTNTLGNLAEYSNYGVNSNIVAPGCVYSIDPILKYQYQVGTSYSAPLVTGCAGLIYGQNRTMPRNSSTADYVKNLILDNTDGVTYSYENRSVTGKLNLQNIFKVPYIKSPDNPKLIIKENRYTKQQIITVKSNNDIDVFYSINGSYPYTKLNKNLRLDKKGTYNISFVAVKSGTKAYSGIITEKIKVSKKVYSQDYLKSVKLKLKNQTIKIETNGKKIDRQRIKWISSNPKIAKIDKNGVITISDNAPKGKKVTFTAQMGNVKKTITIKIRQ